MQSATSSPSNTLDAKLARRMLTTQKSFIREILKVTENPSIISFAGGLPNPELFPTEAMREAANAVLAESGREALQYATTEGFAPLREFIAQRYRTHKGITVSPDEIVITSGSQQSLDLAGKVLLDPGDTVLIERPGYLGAIQTFSLFEAVFRSVELQQDGPNLEQLEQELRTPGLKLFYGVPNFQNPTGLSYSLEKRRAIAALLEAHDTVFLEDDAYGELRYQGDPLPPLSRAMLQHNGLLLGSFSKITAPGLRLGWIVADRELARRIVTAKQGTDLHTSPLTQRILFRFLQDNDLDAHIRTIKDRYGRQCAHMLRCIQEHFPSHIQVTRPAGGMFLWCTLPQGYSARELFDKAIEKNVAFVPGMPFYTDGGGVQTFRLNFSNADEETITRGIARLGACIDDFCNT